MNGLRELLKAARLQSVSGETGNGNPGPKPNLAISSGRLLLGIGFAVLLAISAASIALDARSRSDAAWVDHTLEVLNKISDQRLLIRRAESAARGFLLSSAPSFRQEYQASFDKIGLGFSDLLETVNDNRDQTVLLRSSIPVVDRRLAVSSEMVRLHAAGDTAALATLIGKAEGPVLMDSVEANFDRLTAGENRLLAIRNASAARTEQNLLTIDLSGAALILILGMIALRDFRRSNTKLEISLRATEAANEGLETAVAERSHHLQSALGKLEHSSSVLAGTFAGMAEAVLIVDNKRGILLSNPAAERLLHCWPGMGLDKLEAENRNYQTDGSTLLAAREKPAERALCGEEFDGQEIIIRRSDSPNPLQLLVSGRPLRDASGAITGAAIIYHDMTVSRETERKLHQSQKLDAIGKLTGGVAHDFNNMLTVITGTTEILVADLGDKPELQAVAELINQAADRCAELIQQLLSFARKQPLQPRNVDINAALLDIAKLLRPTLGEQIEIESTLQRGMPTALIDPSQFANALINLAINARDAMPKGGKLILETADAVLDEGYARNNVDVRPGPYVMVALSDTGTGMSPELCEKVFEPFFTTKEAGKGTGLGLSMVYGFVKQSGGHIKIYSEVGHGTTIKLYLPATGGSAYVAAPAILPAPGAGETILVVEDDALVRSFVIAQLQSLGYRTAAASDARAALAYIESGQPFDLLFTDVVMPGGMTGRQLADEVARQQPGTRILYTSGYTENAIVHQGRLDQGILLLSKPYRKSDLANMVRLALGEAHVGIPESGSSPPADTSTEALTQRHPPGAQAPSSGPRSLGR